MATLALREIEGRSRGWWALFALAAALLLGMLLAWHAMETRGHVITGMTNQVVWGLPHVVAVFLILAARNPAAHRSLIAFAAWSSLVHGAIMFVQAFQDSTQAGHLFGDAPALVVVFIVFLLLSPRGAMPAA